MDAGEAFTFTLQPKLDCQQGYRAAGGRDGTYAEACAACDAGKYQALPGQDSCDDCLRVFAAACQPCPQQLSQTAC